MPVGRRACCGWADLQDVDRVSVAGCARWQHHQHLHSMRSRDGRQTSRVRERQKVEGREPQHCKHLTCDESCWPRCSRSYCIHTVKCGKKQGQHIQQRLHSMQALFHVWSSLQSGNASLVISVQVCSRIREKDNALVLHNRKQRAIGSLQLGQTLKEGILFQEVLLGLDCVQNIL